MKLIIDISEELYAKVPTLVNKGSIWIGDVLEAVKNGKSLPKGHGRLGDLNALENEMVNGIKAGLLEEGYEQYGNINDIDDCVECVRAADTIIEADGGGEDEVGYD